MVFLYALPLAVIVVTWGGIVFHLHRVSKFGGGGARGRGHEDCDENRGKIFKDSPSTTELGYKVDPKLRKAS